MHNKPLTNFKESLNFSKTYVIIPSKRVISKETNENLNYRR